MSQRRVLITGGGSGLGRALALRYAKAGCAIAVADIALERAEETVRLLGGAPHLALHVDIGSDDSFQALHDALCKQWDSLDIVFNNAGVASCGGLLDAPMDEWQWMLNINLLGVVRGCRLFAPWLIRQGYGQIVNTASFAGLAGAPAIMTYGVAKAGVVALSEQLRAELVRKNVRVSVICPAFFQTNLLDNFRGNDTRMRDIAARLMATAKVSADDVADHVFRSAERGEFLILPTPGESARWRLKRWFPQLYFKKLLQMTQERAKVSKG